MKKFVPTSYLVLLSLLFFSCNKNESHYIFAPDAVEGILESHIYPVVTKPTEMVIGNPESICTVGETVTLFLPYKVVADDIQNGIISLKDAVTGETVRELEMTLSTDLSVINVTVPEEIQGSSFMFVNIPIEADLLGKTLNVSTKLVAYKQNSEDAVANALVIH